MNEPVQQPDAFIGRPADNVSRPENKLGDDKKSTPAEGNLNTDIAVIKSQARQYALDNGDTNLLIEKHGGE